MTLDDFLDEFRRQRVFVQHGQRAPHKALALLYAMGRLQGGERMTRYQDGAAAIAALLECFGPRRDVQRPSQPIWRLRPRAADAAAIWEVQIEGAAQLPESDNPPEAMLNSRGSFGLSADAAALFRQDPDALALAAGEIADSIMPDTRRDELLAAVFGEQELPSGEGPAPASPTALEPHRRVRTYRIQRDPRFARAVLEAYGNQCAVCRAAPRLGADRFGLEAAHIRWVQYDGPNHVSNGLCLCRMHHVALDRGAFTIGDGHRVRVSPLLDQSEASTRLFWSFDGQPVALPAKGAERPHGDYCRWHQEEVFLASG